MSGDRSDHERASTVWGPDGPPEDPVLLHAGALTAELLGAEIRNLCVDGHEVLQSVYVAVRDQDWGTVAPRIVDRSMVTRGDGFEIRIDVEHVQDDVDFAWHGTIAASSEGSFLFDFDGRARSDFKRNRIGLCLLHGMPAVGRPVSIHAADGSELESTMFPRAISPFQPFLGLRGFSHEWPDGASADLTLAGDEFETEDQRNWSDASFKTYSTPLRLPFPVQLNAGQAVRQTLEMRFASANRDVGRRPSLRVPSVDVVVGTIRRSFPCLGTALQIDRECLSEAEAQRLRQLNLGYARAVVVPSGRSWPEELDRRARDAKALGASLELEVITDDPETATALAEELEQYDVQRCFVFSMKRHVTTAPLMEAYRAAVKNSSPDTAIGGGSRAFFAEFNRAHLPLEHMDVAGFPLSPEVHRTETFALVENLEAQAPMVASARTITGLRPLIVGPVTLLPRYNPNATSDVDGMLPGAEAGGDRRQGSLLCAAWALGSLHQLGAAGAEGLTYFEATGPRGFLPLSAPGAEPHPVFYLFERIARTQPQWLHAIEVLEPLTTQALAVAGATERLVFLTNLKSKERIVRVAAPWSLQRAVVEILDEASLSTATPWELRGADACVGREISISLGPCAIAAISTGVE